jgi:(1->4)-alpha-D-glucan 1-alpha-D-glucosylmutase
VAEFHAYCAKMQATHPHTMTTLSTHDTKRSDDVRARLAVLSEMPASLAALSRWSRMPNARAVQSAAAAIPIATPSTFFIRR